jgi:hypothetical protein
VALATYTTFVSPGIDVHGGGFTRAERVLVGRLLAKRIDHDADADSADGEAHDDQHSCDGIPDLLRGLRAAGIG